MLHIPTASDLIFDEEAHVSRLPNGVVVPHVTGVLSAVRVTADFAEVAELGARQREDVLFARERGKAVHMDCHAYDDEDLDVEQCDPVVRPYVEAWAWVRADLELVPVPKGRERLLFHPLFFYAGIVDGVFVCQRGGRRLRVMPDLKTGDPEDAAAHLQTAAYEAAWNYMHPDQRIDERWAVWLRPELKRRKPYDIINYTARPDAAMDFQKFLACLTVYNEQPARRKRVA